MNLGIGLGIGNGAKGPEAAPAVSAITPSNGKLAAGTVITNLAGFGFINGCTVTIGGAAATSVVWVSTTKLTCVAPVGTAGAKDVVVTNPDTQTGTGTGLYTYNAVPTLSACTPATGDEAGGTAITDLAGTGFLTGAAVTFDAAAATSVAVVSSTKITCVTPSGTAGTADIVVTNPDTQDSGTDGAAMYTYGSAWSPLSASVAPLAWYRADLGVTESGGLVSAWADQSGQADANRNQAASGADRPGYSASDATYGNQPVLTLNGSQFMNAAGAWSAAPDHPISIVVVGEAAAVGSLLCERGGAPPYNLLWADGSAYAKFYSSTGSVTGTSVISSPSAVLCTDDGSDAKIYVGDLTTAQATAATAMGTGTGFDLAFVCAGVSPAVGKIAEIIIFGGVLDATDKANLVTYLNTTRAYGLGVTS